MSAVLSASIQANGWRTAPLYTVPEAARLAGVSTPTVRRWLFGYQAIQRQMPPVFGEQEELVQTGPLVSFLQLAEIVVASRFRRRGVTLERVREAHEFATQEWQLDYPFARLRLEPLGGQILRRFEEKEPGASLLVLDRSGQWTLPGIVVDTIHLFDFEKDLAARWFPVARSVPIVIDPRFSAGLPTIPDRRVTIGAIRRRFAAGQAISFIASDLKLRRPLVEEAIRYAEKVAA